MPPIIAITGRPQDAQSAGMTVRSYLTFHTYSDSVRRGGGLPILLIPVEHSDIDALLDRVDGLVFTGGGDIDPSQYGAERHESVRLTDEERDHFEMELARRAYARKIPTMAICRGLQVVNVALGGTLIQDLVSHTGVDGHDIIGEGAYEPHSQALIDADSRIADIIGAGLHQINSIHHQAIEELGDGVRVVGSAPDGTIEAIEHIDASWYLVAVQWHPELLGVKDHGPSHELFEAFVGAAAKYGANLR